MFKNLLPLIAICMFCTASGQVNLNSGLVAYFPFNGNTLDASGNGNDAVNFGATLTTDQNGNPNSAYEFNGINNFMQIPHNASLNPVNNQITLCARVQPNGFFTGNCYNNMIIGKNTTDGVSGNYSLRFTHTNTASCSGGNINQENFRLDLSTGCDVTTVVNNTPYIALNEWYCLVGVYDGNTIKMYVNGVLRYQCTPSISIGTNSNDVMLGRMSSAGFPYWFNGKMDEVRIYNRALNIQEIDTICTIIPAPAPVIINKYAALLTKGVCDNSFGVDDAGDFNVGDTVLMIQMKGATIDSSNNASFGNILNYNGAGNYEYNIVKSKTGNTLTLKYKVVRQYEIPSGRVQFVRVPSFQTYNVSTKHTCMPWNGSKGGVLVLNVGNTLTINASMDVSGKGFRGGLANIHYSFANICNVTDYYLDTLMDFGSARGEGIADIGINKSFGRGHIGNGGGGGNSHNSGGGGGGNGNAGGDGGRQWANCSGTASYGIGGLGLSYNATLNKLFLGGGGGAGHANENGHKDGGNGGGIIIINAGSIISNGDSLIANGAAAPECTTASSGCNNDGTGGGGGGGLIALKVGNYTGSVHALANGGKGANVMLTSLGIGLTGPGGGGAGGLIWQFGASASLAVNTSTNGGAAGVLPQASNTPNGALAGSIGQSISGLNYSFPQPSDTFRANMILPAFTDSIVSCFTHQFINTSTTNSVGIFSYSWDAGITGTSTQTSPVFTFPLYGTYPVKLIVIDSNGCRDSITRNIIISSPRFANAGRDTATCLGVPATLTASGGISYSWSPIIGLSSPNTATTTATITSSPTQYIVTVTDASGCTDRDTVSIRLAPGLQVSASAAADSACNGKQLQLHATGVTSYSWSPTTGLDNPKIANPIVTVNGNQRYLIEGKDVNGCISYDSIDIFERAALQIVITSDGNEISCYGRAVQLYAKGAGHYVWHPGIYCNDSTIPSPNVKPPVTTRFTVIGTDMGGCTGMDTITVYNFSTSIANMPNAFTPNKDGLNDRIGPSIFCDFLFEKFEVFNRWGQSVFFTYTKNETWDGMFQSEPAPLGVYYYYIKGKSYKGESILLKGDFTLIR